MNILLIGGGGREHALAWQLAQSDKCKQLYCAPGNAGIAECADIIDIAADDCEALVAFAENNDIDLVVVGPEAPLVLGLVDMLTEKGIKAFGPTKAAAQLEGSKGFMKDICKKYDIATAAYGRFSDVSEAIAFIEKQGAPIVVKADGLAAGKGVIIAETQDQAIAAVKDMLEGNRFGDAGHSVVIEEFLDGEEISYFALADGKTCLSFSSAQDHKRVGDGDTGPNTGGMGTLSPSPLLTNALGHEVQTTIIEPLINAMEKENCPFTGVIFAGLMVVGDKPYLLEINTRFGDPECQTLMMRLDCDFLNIIAAAAEGELESQKDEIYWREDSAVCVVMASNGYPSSYQKNTVINGIDDANHMPETKVFHAGTAKNDKGEYVNVGGRVLGITSMGPTLPEARVKAYNAVSKLDWPDGFCRSDIGLKAEKTSS